MTNCRDAKGRPLHVGDRVRALYAPFGLKEDPNPQVLGPNETHGDHWHNFGGTAAVLEIYPGGRSVRLEQTNNGMIPTWLACLVLKIDATEA